MKQAGGGNVAFIETPMAAAIGAGLPVGNAVGCMVIDIGAGKTDAAIISLGDIVTGVSTRFAGDSFDAAIISYIRKNHNILIDEMTAEDVKIKIGSAMPYDGEDKDSNKIKITGRDITKGLPGSVPITPAEVREALSIPVSFVIDTITETLAKTPPKIISALSESGITLVGGSSSLRGIDRLIAEQTGIKVNIPKNPAECVIKGIGIRMEMKMPKAY